MKLTPLDGLDITGKTLLLKEHLVRERYRHCLHMRLVVATGGFGCKPDDTGKVFTQDLYGERPWGSGKIVDLENSDEDGHGVWRRRDFDGIVAIKELSQLILADPLQVDKLDPNNVVLFGAVNGKWAKADSQLRLQDKLRARDLRDAFVAVVHAEAVLDDFGRLTNPPGARAPVILQEPGGKKCRDIQSEFDLIVGVTS